MAGKAARHWTSYWASGALTSLPQDFSGNYEGELAAFWEGIFDSVPAKASVLDVCTGNGAIALLAADWSEARSLEWSIRAVDAAAIDPERIGEAHPEWAGRLERIEFQGNVALESHEEGGEAHDLITSQYGIEYCDWSAVAPRVTRWLRPGGQFVCVSHAPDSVILSTMEAEAAAYERAEQAGVFSLFRDWLGKRIPDGRFHRRLARAREALAAGNPNPEALEKMLVARMGELVNLDRQALRSMAPRVKAFYEQLLHGRDRLRDLVGVNQALFEHPDWYRAFTEAGLELVDSGEIVQHGEHRSGRYYRFRKPPASPR